MTMSRHPNAELEPSFIALISRTRSKQLPKVKARGVSALSTFQSMVLSAQVVVCSFPTFFQYFVLADSARIISNLKSGRHACRVPKLVRLVLHQLSSM